MHKLHVLLHFGLLGVAGTALAADDKGPRSTLLETLDVNGDGLVSLIEFQDRENNILAQLDTDANGVLTLDEFINARPDMGRRGNRPGDGQRQPDAEQVARMQEMRTERATERFQQMDTDGDEIVTLEEFQAGNFAELDRNDDGVLDAEEMRPPRMRGQGPGGRRSAGDRATRAANNN